MLLDRIEAFMREQRTTPTRFGREAVKDAKFVLQLRAGREPRARTLRRVEDYLEKNGSAQVSVAEDLSRRGRNRLGRSRIPPFTRMTRSVETGH